MRTASLGPPRVLIVEDDEFLSRLLGWALESAGCRVTTAVTSAEAGEALEGTAADVIVYRSFDSLSPTPADVDEWRRRSPGCRVVRIWQRPATYLHERRKGSAADADAELEMPFEIQELPDLVLDLCLEARKATASRRRNANSRQSRPAPAPKGR